jgi:hypothetical protein
MPPSRSKWKNQFHIIEGNSNFHEEVRKILSTDPFFSKLRCFQEVPVQDICPKYSNKSHRFDWYIEELGIVLELHGRQHYQFSNRGNIQYEQAQRDFYKGRARDGEKQVAAEEAGHTYRVISYKEYGKLTADRLKKLILGE